MLGPGHLGLAHIGLGHLDVLETDLLRAFPQHVLAECSEILEAGSQCHEMIAGELSHLAGEPSSAIGQRSEEHTSELQSP